MDSTPSVPNASNSPDTSADVSFPSAKDLSTPVKPISSTTPKAPERAREHAMPVDHTEFHKTTLEKMAAFMSQFDILNLLNESGALGEMQKFPGTYNGCHLKIFEKMESTSQELWDHIQTFPGARASPVSNPRKRSPPSLSFDAVAGTSDASDVSQTVASDSTNDPPDSEADVASPGKRAKRE